MENSQERKHLRGYREAFEKLRKAKQKRDAIAAALETVETDSAGAASLRASLRQLEETIARYDGRLTKLESSKPLQALLTRLRRQELPEALVPDRADNSAEVSTKELNVVDKIPVDGIMESESGMPKKVVDSYYCTTAEYKSTIKRHAAKVSKRDKCQICAHVKTDGTDGGYVATRNYSNINSYLREDGYSSAVLDEDDRLTVDALRRAILNNTLGGNYTLTRYVNADYLSHVFGIMDNTGLLLGNTDILADRKGKIKERILRQIKESIGTTKKEKAFVSTSLIINRNVIGNGKAVRLTLKAAANTHCYIPRNKRESECILGEGTEYRVDDAFFTIDGLLEIVLTVL